MRRSYPTVPFTPRSHCPAHKAPQVSKGALPKQEIYYEESVAPASPKAAQPSSCTAGCSGTAAALGCGGAVAAVAGAACLIGLAKSMKLPLPPG